MICGMTLYQIFWYFIIYSLIGWMIEVVFHAVTQGKIVNRGFLNGPICPVYGSGVLMVLIVLFLIGSILGIKTSVEVSHPMILFAIGIVFASLIEFLAGFILDKLFHARWWDYSDRKFNINGYICLEFSIIWGLAIAFVLRVIQPGIENIIDMIPHMLGDILLIIIYMIFVADIVITVLTVLKMNKQLERMEDIQKSILKISDEMSEIIGSGTIKTMDTLEKGYETATKKQEQLHENLNENKEELLNAIKNSKEDYQKRRQELEERFEHLKKEFMYSKLFGTRRLLTAFPGMKHNLYQKMIDKLKDNK